MNEPTAPTAPTIEEMLAYLDNEGPELNTATEIDAMVAAIRVLEAAGKLSMDKTIDRLKAGMIPLALIDLLAALPDAPKEEK